MKKIITILLTSLPYFAAAGEGKSFGQFFQEGFNQGITASLSGIYMSNECSTPSLAIENHSLCYKRIYDVYFPLVGMMRACDQGVLSPDNCSGIVERLSTFQPIYDELQNRSKAVTQALINQDNGRVVDELNTFMDRD